MKVKAKAKRDAAAGQSFVNEHCAYRDLSKPDRRALRATLATAFPLGGGTHKLWSDFPDTTAFLRRRTGPHGDDLPEGVIGGAIVMSYPEAQYDYLAYIAIRPDYRRQRAFLRHNAPRPHHGTALLHSVYDVMRGRIGATRLQQYLMIEPSSEEAMKFYLRALPVNDYPLKFFSEDRIILVGYDGFTL